MKKMGWTKNTKIKHEGMYGNRRDAMDFLLKPGEIALDW